MHKPTALALLVAFALGCATAHVLEVQPAHAQAGPKWEYYCFVDDEAADVLEKANKAGKQGWEMVTYGKAKHGLNESTWCFKRPLE